MTIVTVKILELIKPVLVFKYLINNKRGKYE